MSQNKNVFDTEFDEEETHDLESEDFELKDPFDPKKIDIQPQQTTMDNLIKRLKYNEIDLFPEFQRTAGLWSINAKSRLIESLFIRLPLPAFYFDATDDNKWQVVDGLQRLWTIRDFTVEKKMKLKGMEFTKKCEGLTYDELNRVMQRRIDEAPVTLYLIKPGTPKNVKYSLFHRINTGGLTLNAQEIRHALNQSINNGRASKFLRKLSQTEMFKKCVRVSEKRMLDRELVLRYIGFQLSDYHSYKAPMIKHLNDTMEQLGSAKEESLNDLELKFYNALSLCWDLFNENGFRKSFVQSHTRKVLNRALFEVFTTLFAKLEELKMKMLRKNKAAFLKDYEKLLGDRAFIDSISTSTTYSDNIRFRFEKVSQLIERHCHGS